MLYDLPIIMWKNIQQIFNEPLNQTNRNISQDRRLWFTNATVILT